MALLRTVEDSDLDVLFAHWTDEESNRMAAFTAADPSDRAAFDARWERLRVLEKCGFRLVGGGTGFANARGEETRELVFRLDA